MLPNLGGGELVILLVIILVFFGAKRIPELARSLGTGMREFKRGTSGEANEKDEVQDRDKEEEGKLPQAEAAQNANSGALRAEKKKEEEEKKNIRAERNL